MEVQEQCSKRWSTSPRWNHVTKTCCCCLSGQESLRGTQCQIWQRSRLPDQTRCWILQ